MSTSKATNKTKKKFKFLDKWKGTNRDRFLLFGIILGVYLFGKLIDLYVPTHYLDKLPSHVSLTLLGVIVLIMLLHTIYTFFAQFHRRRNPLPLDENYQPSIDIFISAHNEESVITDTINHLLDLEYPQLSIFIVNDRSKDSTREQMMQIDEAKLKAFLVRQGLSEDLEQILEKAKTEDHESFELVKIAENFNYVHRKQTAFPGKAAALNDVFSVSKSEVVCVLDADARIDKGFLKSIVRYLADPMVAAAQAQKVISNPELNFLTKCQSNEYAMDTYFQMGRDSIRGATELRGNGELIKRKVLEEVGGWNEETITDDLDLSTCLHVNGWDIRFSPEDKVYEEAVPDISGFIKQRRRWAEGSMRRYLNYLLQLMTPGNLSLNQISDTFFFFGQFCLPLWLSWDLIYELVNYYLGNPTSFSFYMLITMGAGIITFITQFNGLRLYRDQNLIEAVFNTFITNTYLVITWITVILITYRKILFSRKVGTWTATTHGAKKA